MQMSFDDDRDSVLGCAARNKSPDEFEAVVSGIENDVTPQEVRNNDNSDLIRHMFEGRMHPWPALDAEVNVALLKMINANPNLFCCNTS